MRLVQDDGGPLRCPEQGLFHLPLVLRLGLPGLHLLRPNLLVIDDDPDTGNFQGLTENPLPALAWSLSRNDDIGPRLPIQQNWLALAVTRADLEGVRPGASKCARSNHEPRL